jgi:hypothetical protein
MFCSSEQNRFLRRLNEDWFIGRGVVVILLVLTKSHPALHSTVPGFEGLGLRRRSSCCVVWNVS